MLFCDPTSIISTQPSKWSGTRRLLLGGAHRIAMACCLNPRASNLSSHLLARERDWLNITISRYGNQLTNWMEFWWCLMVFEFSTVSWFSYFHPTKIIGLNSARYPATFSEVRYGAITSAAELGFFLENCSNRFREIAHLLPRQSATFHQIHPANDRGLRMPYQKLQGRPKTWIYLS